MVTTEFQGESVNGTMWKGKSHNGAHGILPSLWHELSRATKLGENTPEWLCYNDGIMSERSYLFSVFPLSAIWLYYFNHSLTL